MISNVESPPRRVVLPYNIGVVILVAIAALIQLSENLQRLVIEVECLRPVHRIEDRVESF